VNPRVKRVLAALLIVIGTGLMVSAAEAGEPLISFVGALHICLGCWEWWRS
jgi:hypothetical protein